jgi:hypothetical protein
MTTINITYIIKYVLMIYITVLVMHKIYNLNEKET